LAPVAVFTVLALAFAVSLRRDPSLVPSALIGHPVPEFSLPPVQGRARGLASENLRGSVALVNVFASWCVPCRLEHPLLMRLGQEVPLYGINYKDKPADAAHWLDEMGDPYTRTGANLDGRVSIDWGVYGVPETFVVDRDGRIAFKQTGPIDVAIIEQKLRPILAKLGAYAPQGGTP
jgi:cytochrome c biogenesis protein CcmG/thiol:disulfide interchange protein DsbE